MAFGVGGAHPVPPDHLLRSEAATQVRTVDRREDGKMLGEGESWEEVNTVLKWDLAVVIVREGILPSHESVAWLGAFIYV